MYRLVLLALLTACTRDPADTGKGADTEPPDDTALPPVDEDGDGFLPSEGDCDDTDPERHPDAVESCNEVDDDCDGTIDEDLGQAFWTDADGDGHGDPDAPLFSCELPAGAAENNDDCDDADAAIHPGAEEPDCLDPVDYNCDGSTGYADDDGDGFAACEECDDADPAVSPDAAETCNERDDDCDGTVDEEGSAGEATWYADADGDGFGADGTALLACEAPEGMVADATDCDDALAAVHPGADETCNALDDDCDGGVDEDAIDGTAWHADADGDGHGDPDSATLACEAPEGMIADATDCDDTLATTSPSAAETCNAVDDDCDGDVDEDASDAAAWYYDADGDGYGNADVSMFACDAPAGYVASADDCNDGAASASPAGVETCDGLDNDCDGTVDDAEGGAPTWYRDADGDGYGDLAVSVSSCTAPAGYVATSSDCDDAVAAVSPAAAETCDAVDNDCDGSVDETGGLSFYADADGDGYGDPGVVVAGCAAADGYVANDDDCDDALAGVHPLATETCDGVDEDCDGAIDDGAGTVWYRDADGDGYGVPGATTRSCAAPTGYAATDDDCDDGSSSFSPGAAEVCADGLDQDCDGAPDDDCPETVEHCGTISSDETWSGEDLHLVTCDVYVQGSSAPLLLVEDGATVEFSPGTAIVVGWSSHGELWVDGHTDGVTFTSGDTRPGAGDWDGLQFGGYDRGSWIEGATIEYGGYNGYGNVYAVNTPLLTIVDSVVTDSSNSGVYLNNATLDISGTTVADNVDYGVYLASNAALSTTGGATFAENVLTGNGLYPLTVPAPYVHAIAASNTFAGNGTDAVYVYGGTVATSATWNGLDVPYYVAADVAFGAAAGIVVTMGDGAELQFASGAGLNVGSSSYVDFLVDGATTGVTFTSARTSPRAGDWDGLYFGPYAQRAELVGATVRYGGANGYGNVYVNQAEDTLRIADSTLSDSSTNGVYVSWYAEAEIRDSVIAENADHGVYVYDAGALAGDLSFSGNTVEGNDVGLSIPAMDGGALGPDGTYTGNLSDDVVLRADTVTADTTLRPLDAWYHVTGDITVAAASRPTLTLADGAELRFDGGAGLYVGSGTYGSLDVQGSSLGVTLTSAADVPAPGDWDGVQFTWWNVASTVRGATVAYGGANGYGNLYMNPSSYVSGGSVLVEGCTVHDGAESGVYLVSSANVTIADTVIRDNADYGVLVDTNSALATEGEPSFSGNTITGNGLYPLRLPITSLDQLDGTSTFSGNGTDRVYVTADVVSASGTWPALDVPYLLHGDSRIEGSTTPVITIEPGATLLFNYFASLSVATFNYGKLMAIGTAEAPIVFSSGQDAPAAGDWDGLALYASDTGSTLQHVEVRYGGGSQANVYLQGNGSRVTISDATIADSATYGIRRNSATPTLTDVTYAGNASGDLY